MIGALGTLGALDTLGLEAPQVGFTTGAGGITPPPGDFILTNDAGTLNLTADNGSTVLTSG
jgi:hypothetical protein